MTDLKEVFEYLDELRASGETNMFGAVPYVQRQFSLERDEAKPLWSLWTKTFDGVSSVEDRVKKAQEL